jgi:hypothetical protein
MDLHHLNTTLNHGVIIHHQLDTSRIEVTPILALLIITLLLPITKEALAMTIVVTPLEHQTKDPQRHL